MVTTEDIADAIEHNAEGIAREASHDVHYNARLYISTPIINRDSDPDLFLAAEHLAKATCRALLCCDGVIAGIADVFEECGYTEKLDKTDLKSPTFASATASFVARLACNQAVADLDLAVTDNDHWSSRATDAIWEGPDPCMYLRDTSLGRQLA